MQKVYEVDPFICPKCQGTMSVVAIIEDSRGLARIIDWAKQQERNQTVTVCARSPPEKVDENFDSIHRRCRKILVGITVRVGKTVVVRCKTRISTQIRENPDMTVPVS